MICWYPSLFSQIQSYRSNWVPSTYTWMAQIFFKLIHWVLSTLSFPPSFVILGVLLFSHKHHLNPFIFLIQKLRVTFKMTLIFSFCIESGISNHLLIFIFLCYTDCASHCYNAKGLRDIKCSPCYVYLTSFILFSTGNVPDW